MILSYNTKYQYKKLSNQALMEIERDCLNNHLWKWKETVWTTAGLAVL
jgi:hypothetical protein